MEKTVTLREAEGDWMVLIPEWRCTVEEFAAFLREYKELEAAGLSTKDATIQAWEKHIEPWKGPIYDQLLESWEKQEESR